MKRIIVFLAFNMILQTGTHSQSTFNGWLASSHEQQLSKKWSLLSDIQVRSADQFKYFETILLRPGIQYKFNELHSIATGYAYFGNWMDQGEERTFDLEHRIWEQYQLETDIGNKSMTNRLRLEQRFLQSEEGFDFAQRLRYFLRFQIPLVNQKEFKQGAYVGIQNEIFLNVQHKEKVNNKYFDQNRTFAAIGYRLNEAVDVEGGYLFRYQVAEEKMKDHIIQVLVTTKL